MTTAPVKSFYKNIDQNTILTQGTKPQVTSQLHSTNPTIKDIDVLKIQVTPYLNGAANYK